MKQELNSPGPRPLSCQAVASGLMLGMSFMVFREEEDLEDK